MTSKPKFTEIEIHLLNQAAMCCASISRDNGHSQQADEFHALGQKAINQLEVNIPDRAWLGRNSDSCPERNRLVVARELLELVSKNPLNPEVHGLIARFLASPGMQFGS